MSHLFFDILAKNIDERGESSLNYLPYLNSSLFIKQDKELVDISQLLSSPKMEYFKNTQIKDNNGKRLEGQVELLEYLFQFLDAFDFSSIPSKGGIRQHKDLINPSILGLVFEQLNNYADGSFYTKSAITSYMSKESIVYKVLSKFREHGLNADNLDELAELIVMNRCRDKNFVNKAINIMESVTIGDPAVGSGHFLVSALNEMVYIYYKLGLLNNHLFAELKIENDEVIIIDNEGEIFEYKRPKANTDNHKIQTTIFNVKKSIIENNLFGVDINPNSCEITTLRLWIELLKNTYYLSFKNDNYHNMQTLPNIDINIKCGNSLISNIDLTTSKENFLDNLKARIEKADMFEQSVLKKEFDEISIEMPKMFANLKEASKAYKNASSKEEAKKHKKVYEDSKDYLIKLFRKTCDEYINFYSSLHDFFEEYGYININNIEDMEIKNKLISYVEQFDFHRFVDFEKKQVREINPKALAKIKTVMAIYEEFEHTEAFEWRFEFPELLDDNGDFKGFDVIIGNPPYVLILKENENYYKYKAKYKTASGGKINLYNLFFEQSFFII